MHVIYTATRLMKHFSGTTLSHLKPQQGLPDRYQRRALDVTLTCKLTHVYGKYHLAMLHRELAMSDVVYSPLAPPTSVGIAATRLLQVQR